VVPGQVSLYCFLARSVLANQKKQSKSSLCLKNESELMAAVLLSLTLLVLVVQTGQSAPQHKKQKRKYDREWKTKRGECLRGECNNLHLDENDNCLNLCTSNNCYEEVYGNTNGGALEPGEVDSARWHRFQRCARGEIKSRIKEKWQAERQAAKTKSGV
jgi:hypothetical protein